MNEKLFMIVSLLTGVVIGSVFFGGLWFTVKKGMTSKIPALWFLGSFVFRMGIVLLGYYLILQNGSWLNGLICLTGFIVARFIVIRQTRIFDAKATIVKEERKGVGHEA